MKLILRGRRFGFSLEEIRQWLELYGQKGTSAQSLAWIEMADRQLDALAKQQDELAASIADLRQLRDEVAQKIGDGTAG